MLFLKTEDVVQLVESLHKAWVIPCTHDLLTGARLGVSTPLIQALGKLLQVDRSLSVQSQLSY